MFCRATGRKVEDPDLLEGIRLTIINNLLKYHPVCLTCWFPYILSFYLFFVYRIIHCSAHGQSPGLVTSRSVPKIHDGITTFSSSWIWNAKIVSTNLHFNALNKVYWPYSDRLPYLSIVKSATMVSDYSNCLIFFFVSCDYLGVQRAACSRWSFWNKTTRKKGEVKEIFMFLPFLIIENICIPRLFELQIFTRVMSYQFFSWCLVFLYEIY